MLFLFPDSYPDRQEITHSEHQTKTQSKIVDIVRDPADVPPAVGNRQPALVHVTLTAEEVVGTLDPSAGTTPVLDIQR